MVPLRVSWKAIADELTRLDPDGRGSPPSSEPTRAILFDREVSIRRALILALGRHDATTIPDGERKAIAGKLLASYRKDPDAGIRGAAGWTLRRWGLAERLAAADADLKGTGEASRRRWFVNGEGQTFAVIDGPREFLMGSPPTDTERTRSIEAPRRYAIPRWYAIGVDEVTIAQFERFAATHRRYRLDAGLKQLTAGPDGPQIGVNWYAAAAYCNWLSEREGLGEDQWCYLPGPDRSYADGMTIPADSLDLAGYRLPTEAEWEYQCRAGAATSRFHGTSIELLGARAWYGRNSDNRCQPCGRLLPNDLGLFDMLGNVYEWCHDRDAARRPGREAVIIDAGGIAEVVRDNRIRMFRGGSYVGSPDEVRSSARSGELPSYLGDLNGFRLGPDDQGAMTRAWKPAPTIKPS